MRAERLQRIGALRDEGGEVDAADRGFGRLVVRQGLLQPPDMVERQSDPANGRLSASRAAVSDPPSPARVAASRLSASIASWWSGGSVGMLRRQELEAQMFEIKRADAQRRADVLQQRRRLRRSRE